jgi:hypothetical protein
MVGSTAQPDGAPSDGQGVVTQAALERGVQAAQSAAAAAEEAAAAGYWLEVRGGFGAGLAVRDQGPQTVARQNDTHRLCTPQSRPSLSARCT